MAACPPGQAGAAKNLDTKRFFIPLRLPGWSDGLHSE